ncbi:hypothetical protein F5B22DRAFT_524155 [Xylaria bambusicola]|uniref:uncharacterized protein n=1 Tax=Xylaria bambusicola TaxID=326684 RepID=UPI002008A6DA|nr:uncharacterized protein F5B22DRAFT_524155 [Xylaria bambusicola]KAI0505428.1 hypothetical protein F5B22DRAFT_524155 [Xylaria bambusicola]
MGAKYFLLYHKDFPLEPVLVLSILLGYTGYLVALLIKMAQLSSSNGNANPGHDTNGLNGQTTCASGNTHEHTNGTNNHVDQPSTESTGDKCFEPIAICGMACRLPGGISSPQALWDFLIEGRDGRIRVPKSRFNIDSFYSPVKRPGMAATQYGYFLDETVDLGGLDTSFFSMSRMEVEWLDPQQRMMLEVARESLDDAGEVGWKGKNIGVYVGSYGQDWYDILQREPLSHSTYSVITSHDFMVSERVSHELDLRGPSMTIRTACSSALIGLNEACMAIFKGDCESAIVGGTNLILAPDLFTRLSDQNFLSPDGECRTFSADANGYARGEAVVSIYVKSLSAALRDGNPIRSVISGSATNFDGKTNPLTSPSATAQEALIRRAYKVAGISDFSRTALFECHGTGTATGDPIETEAVASVFGGNGIYIGAVKPNLGHSEGASGLTAVMKATLALQHRTIPPNIKYSPPNPKIPFESAKLQIPTEPTAWPIGRDERVSINSFGVGGSNAHVILEAPGRFLPASQMNGRDTPTATDKPQLLIFSANTAYSMKDLVQEYQSLLSNSNDINLSDVAYTLANRREHLAHRSFAIASHDRFDIASSMSPQQSGQVTPSIVMVFTGQGAAWPGCGRELMRSSRIFSQTIQSLDKHLQTLGADAPSWTLEEELMKPARTSRVHEAEISQPLCTAIQLALVDALAAIGIRPAAVVGHSSGEMAAAYAAGGLTAREAITVAFYRGVKAKLCTRHGGMAAVGLCYAEAQKYLVPGVTIACDNSTNSVTLSGDADKLEQVVADIKASHENVPATVLKVDKAYHSYHMEEVGESYFRAMVASEVVGEKPSIPFFSSVRGKRFGTGKADQLGPVYWRENLQRPVLFKSAVTGIIRCEDLKNQVYLEIGPHSALAGPIRQILVTESSKATYVASLVRRQNSLENLLQAIGKLYLLRVPIDFKSLMPSGTCLTDLPRYPWDHQRRHWFESRLAKEWRERKYPEHSLLGSKLPESTDLEPIWRNFVGIRTTPWLQDHRIGENAIFPFAGYLSMAAEAARQITGIEEGVSLRNVIVNTALVVPEDSAIEVVTSLRHHKLTDSLDSEWWDFTICSHNGHVWTKHCWGQVRGESSTAPMKQPHNQESPLPRRVDVSKWYEAQRRQGLSYGPAFARMEELRTSTRSPDQATAKMRNLKWGDEAQYHLHPAILDTFFQLQSSSNFNGLSHAYRRLILTSVEAMTIYRCTEDELEFTNMTTPAKGCVATGTISSGSRILMTVTGCHSSFFEESDMNDEESVPITARGEWFPHIDFSDAANLVHHPEDYHSTLPLLSKMAGLAINIANKLAKGIEVQAPHLDRYKNWLIQEASTVPESSDASSMDELHLLAKRLQSTSVASSATTMITVLQNLEAVLRGNKTGFEILSLDGNLDGFITYLWKQGSSPYLKCLAQSKTTMRVLEVGAGIGEKTANIIKDLTHTNGSPLYSRYVVADASSDLLNVARERLKELRNVEFSTMNINEAMESQGFEDASFDVIIAAGVVNTSANIQKSLQGLRGLLSPNGRLLLEEPRTGLLWAKFVLGILPNWWSHTDDGRELEPFVDATRWQEELRSAGFGDVQQVEHWTNSVLVARPSHPTAPKKKITLLCADESSAPSLILQELASHGYEVQRASLGQPLPQDQDVLALLDEERPFFENLGAESFMRLKSLMLQDLLSSSSLLWVTRRSSIECKDPRFAQIIGFARSLRSETAVNIATCEMDEVITPGDASALVRVLGAFQMREEGGVLGPDYEYTISGGETLVHRIFPFALEKELQFTDESDEACVSIGQPGRIDTLTWSSHNAAAPKDGEVEIEVYASGLNFRDVLVGMQIVPGSKFGYEAAGVVRRVGPNVKKLCVGDRAVVMSANTFSTVIIESELLCEKLPDNISFLDGACTPTVFLTAVYGLIDLGRLTKGQSILIHSACGGVGLSAIQVARMLGVEIYATVGSDLKAQYLIDTFGIPRSHIFNSRNISFADDLLRETGGKGVDVALNSLSGEMLHATWKCVAKFGTLVEIGKRDLLENARLEMQHFLANRNYCCLDMDQMRIERPEINSRLLRFTMEAFAKGDLRPIRIDQVFEAPAILDAFRYMQQGKHIGKIVVEIRKSNGKLLVDNVNRTKKYSLQLDATASYLLVGGLGGLGRSMSVWMVQRGARNLTFLSRSAGNGQHDMDFVREIESMGCTIQLVRGDVTNADDVARAVNGTVAPLKGIVQMSMVLRDRMFDNMSFDDWNAVTQPKVQGTWNLHNITSAKGLDLDFFLLFSSLSGVIGQVGQSNYASANTFLDAFVEYRTSQGLPCTAIDLGAMEGVGYLSENQELLRKMQGSGWRAVQEIELLDALDLAMRRSTACASQGQGPKAGAFILGFAPTAPLSSPDSSARLRRDVRLAAYHNIRNSNAKTTTKNDGLSTLLTLLRKNPVQIGTSETITALSTAIGQKLFGLLLIADRDVDITSTTADLGLDSLVAVELRAWWKQNFGFDISTMEMLSAGTLEALGKRAADGIAMLYGS